MAKKKQSDHRRNQINWSLYGLIFAIILVVICVVVWIIALVLGELQQSAQPTNLPVVEKSTTTGPLAERRIIAQREWISCAKKMFEKTKLKEVEDILNFVKTHGASYAPTSYGVVSIGNENAIQPVFKIIVLFPDDAMLGGIWPVYLGGKLGAAGYNPVRRWLVLHNGDYLSDLTKGLMVIHEGRHAMQYLTHPDWDSADAKTFCYDERDAHELEMRLLGILGRDGYSKYRKAKMQKLAKMNFEQQLDLWRLTCNSDDGLGKVFHPQSSFEFDALNTLAWFDAQFCLIDHDKRWKSQAEKEDQKAILMRVMFKMAGLCD